MIAQLQAATVRGLVVDQQHPALACREGLRAVEAERAECPERARRTALVRGAGGLGGVLDHSDTALAA